MQLLLVLRVLRAILAQGGGEERRQEMQMANSQSGAGGAKCTDAGQMQMTREAARGVKGKEEEGEGEREEGSLEEGWEDLVGEASTDAKGEVPQKSIV